MWTIIPWTLFVPASRQGANAPANERWARYLRSASPADKETRRSARSRFGVFGSVQGCWILVFRFGFGDRGNLLRPSAPLPGFESLRHRIDPPSLGGRRDSCLRSREKGSGG